MIPRYEDPSIRAIWDPHEVYKTFVIVALDNLKGIMPEDLYEQISHTPLPAWAQMVDVESRTRHDVAAFLDVWSKTLPDEAQPYIHYGMTSSDLVDTAHAILIRRSCIVVHEKIRSLFLKVKSFALSSWTDVRVGRTHGQAADITTIGYRFGGFAERLLYADRIVVAMTNQSAKLSGPVGTYPNGVQHAQQAAARMQLAHPWFTTQVLPREHRSRVVYYLAEIGAILEDLAEEIRHSSRSDVHELFLEPQFGSVGSSAMPHKANPVEAETMIGLARLLRGYVAPMLEGVALLHERDISHSSVDRVALVDAFHLVARMLYVSHGLMHRLRVDRDACKRHLEGTLGQWATHRAMTFLQSQGWARGDAYETVRQAAGRSTVNNTSFGHELKTLVAGKVEMKDVRAAVGLTRATADLLERLEPARQQLSSWKV